MADAWDAFPVVRSALPPSAGGWDDFPVAQSAPLSGVLLLRPQKDC